MTRALGRAAVGIVLALAGQPRVQAADDLAGALKPAAASPVAHGLVELKRQATARGTPEETTKTNLKFDYFPHGSLLALLRLELPFPDEKTTFGGSPFDPDFGDAKVRAGFAAAPFLGRPTTSFVELTFPTADPGSQGTGKVQLSAGAKMAFAQPRGCARVGSPAQVFSMQLQQVVPSVLNRHPSCQSAARRRSATRRRQAPRSNGGRHRPPLG